MNAMTEQDSWDLANNRKLFYLEYRKNSHISLLLYLAFIKNLTLLFLADFQCSPWLQSPGTARCSPKAYFF